MANPWDDDPVVDEEKKTSENPWDNDPVVDLPEDPEQGMDFNTYVNKLDDPYALQQDIDANNDVRSLELGGPTNRDDLLMSKDELYGDVNQILETSDEFAPLREYENSLLYAGGVQTPFGHYSLKGKTPPEIEALKKKREEMLQAEYQKWGKEESYVIPENIPIVGGMDTGITYRTQEVAKNNPDFDPTQPEGPDNQSMVRERYLLDPPDSDAATRIAYQVMQNIVGGLGDAVAEGKLLEEGKIGKSLPEQVPNSGAEGFVTELTTFVLGPKTVEVAAKGIAKGTGIAGKAAGGAMVGKIASMMTPEDIQAVRTVYTETLAKTKSGIKAYNAANSVVKRMLVGSAIGLTKAGAYGTVEAAVAPTGSEGLLSPESVKSVMPNLSDEQAKDAAFILDTPIIHGTLGTLGRAYQFGAKQMEGIVGGVRNIEVFGINPANNRLTQSRFSPLRITEKDAGLKTFLWIDESAVNSTPKELAFRIKVFGDALERNAIKTAQIGDVNKTINMDTAASFSEAARDYYRIAYANKAEEMGVKEFNDWVADQANKTSNRLFELRTSILGDSETLTKTSVGSKEIERLFAEGADSQAGGDLLKAQSKAGEALTDIKLSKDAQIEGNLNVAKQEMDTAKAQYENAIFGNPEVRKLIDEVDSAGGSKSGEFKKLEGMSEKVYQSLKTMKSDYEQAYKAIGDSGAVADTGSLLKIIQEGNVDDPVLKRIAENINKSDDFGHIYNNVRTEIGKEIGLAQKAGNSERLTTLHQLKDNINEYQMDWLKTNGDADVVQMADEAKQKYINYITTFKDNTPIKSVTKMGEQRLRGEKMPTGLGPGQGVTDYKVQSAKFIEQNLDGPDGKLLRESLQRAANAGGNSIDKDIADYYAIKAFGNLADGIAKGKKQDVNTLRQSIRGYIEGMEEVNKPLADKLKQLEVDIQTLENTAGNKEEAFRALQDKTNELRKLSQQSVLEKFIYTMEDGTRVPLKDTGGILKKIYNAPDAPEKIMDLYKIADENLGPNAKIIKDAIKGTYIDHVSDKLISRRPLGITGVDEIGNPETAFKINESNFAKVFDPKSKDMQLMKQIYQDNPEIIGNLEELSGMYLRLTKSSPQARNNVLGPLPRSLNPESGMQSIIYIMFGPLSRTGTIAKRVTGPMTIDSLEQVKQVQEKALISMMAYPEEFSSLIKDIGKGITEKEARQKANAILVKAMGRTAVTSQEDKPEYYPVPQGVK